MRQWFEVRHCNKCKKFDIAKDAIKFGCALEKLGYKVKLSLVTINLYTSIRTLLYESQEETK